MARKQKKAEAAVEQGGGLAGQAYRAVLERLMSGRLPPGTMLDRRSVAEELGMSVAPVLEAMLQLEADGFLEALPRRGTRVRLVDREAVRGQLIVREALECEAARMYCGDPIRDAFSKLLPLAEKLDRGTGLPADGWHDEVEFHGALVALANCGALNDAFSRVMRQGLFFAVIALNPPADIGRSSHVTLLGKLKTQDADAAEKIIRQHLRSGKEHILGSI